jgi:hypothetical protein
LLKQIRAKNNLKKTKGMEKSSEIKMAMKKSAKKQHRKKGRHKFKTSIGCFFFQNSFLSMMKSLYKKNMSNKEIYIIKK